MTIKLFLFIYYWTANVVVLLVIDGPKPHHLRSREIEGAPQSFWGTNKIRRCLRWGPYRERERGQVSSQVGEMYNLHPTLAMKAFRQL